MESSSSSKRSSLGDRQQSRPLTSTARSGRSAPHPTNRNDGDRPGGGAEFAAPGHRGDRFFFFFFFFEASPSSSVERTLPNAGGVGLPPPITRFGSASGRPRHRCSTTRDWVRGKGHIGRCRWSRNPAGFPGLPFKQDVFLRAQRRLVNGVGEGRGAVATWGASPWPRNPAYSRSWPRSRRLDAVRSGSTAWFFLPAKGA